MEKQRTSFFTKEPAEVVSGLYDSIYRDGLLMLAVLRQLSFENTRIITSRLFWLLHVTFNIDQQTILYLIHYFYYVEKRIQIHAPFSGPFTPMLGSFPEESFITLTDKELGSAAFELIKETLPPFHLKALLKLESFDINNYSAEVSLNDLLNFNVSM